MHIRKCLKVSVINLLIIIFVFILIECVSHVLEPKKFWDTKEFRLSRPEPYFKSPYFSEEFIGESLGAPGGWLTPPGTNIVKPSNFNGKYIHSKDGIRLTVGVPSKAKQNLYLFGGSTIWNGEVPDEYTVASLLQKLINEQHYSVRVINYGATTVQSAQQLERLKNDVDLSPDDVVIFYDGVNEVYQRIYFGNPQGWIVEEFRKTSAFIKFVRYMSQYSAFFRWLNRNFTERQIFEFKPGLLEEASTAYLGAIKETNTYVSSRGAFFYHFLQPNIATKKLNLYEKDLIQLNGIISPGLFEAFIYSYPSFEKVMSTLPYNKNLLNIFDDMQLSPYLDSCHVTEEANMIIASELLKTISLKLKKDIKNEVR